MHYHDNVHVNVALSSTDLSLLLAIPPAQRNRSCSSTAKVVAISQLGAFSVKPHFTYTALPNTACRPLSDPRGGWVRDYINISGQEETKSRLTSCNRHHKVQILWSRGTDLLYPYCCSWSDTDLQSDVPESYP